MRQVKQPKHHLLKASPAFFIGLSIGLLLFVLTGWWGLPVIGAWVGGAVTLGIYLSRTLPRPRHMIGPKVAGLVMLPLFMLFIPVSNNENLQLEGVVLLLTAGYFSKGVIHWAVAKVFGPLVWGRGFCGWACWTGAVLEWLPMKEEKIGVPRKLWQLRYLALAISVALPLVMVFALGFDVRGSYLHKTEMLWMLVGNAVYYLLAIPLAYAFNDRRAFCKIACPIAPVMKLPTRFARIKRRASVERCIVCGHCNTVCPMEIDVMEHIRHRKPIRDTECILCNKCKLTCPVGAID